MPQTRITKFTAWPVGPEIDDFVSELYSTELKTQHLISQLISHEDVY